MYRLCLLLLAANLVCAKGIISNFSYTHQTNKTELSASWQAQSSNDYHFAKVFMCNSYECIESVSGEFSLDRNVYNQNISFSKSFFAASNLRVVIKGLSKTTNKLEEIFTKPLSLTCDRELYKGNIKELTGPIDLNCDGTIDVLAGYVRPESLAVVYPLVTTFKDDSEISFTQDSRFVIDRRADARSFNSQSCKVKVVSKSFFIGDASIKFLGAYSRDDSSLYEIPKDFSMTESDCKHRDGQYYCSKVLDLCDSRPSYLNSSKMVKGYDRRAYRVELAGVTIGSYYNKCDVNSYRYDGHTFNVGVKDGLDNDCSGVIDEQKSFSNYCRKVDPTGAREICNTRCKQASSSHLLNVFRFPKTCESYGGRFPLWSSSTKRISKSVCYARSRSETNSFQAAINSCDTCSKRINKKDSAWQERRIEDSCSNYSRVKGYKSRAAYTSYSADYENCAARVKCDIWKDSSGQDMIYY